MAKILCLDYGNVRLGVAITHSDNTLAMARDYINVKKGNVLNKLKSLIAENGCEEIVVGLPLSLNGQDTQKTTEVRTFAAKLEELLDVKITLWDERLTSYEADRLMEESHVKIEKRKEKRDSLAAQIILQDYLDSLGPSSFNG